MTVLRRVRVDGGTLRSRLLVLVVIPLLGVAAFATAEVNSRLSTADQAHRAATLVRAAGRLDQTRGALLHELIPGLARSAVRDPTLATLLGINAAGMSTLLPSAATVKDLRDATDRSVSAIAADPAVGSSGSEIGNDVARLRTEIDTNGQLENAFADSQAIVKKLNELEHRQLANAVLIGVTGESRRAIEDLSSVATVVQFAELEVPSLATTKFTNSSGLANPAQSWVQTWGGYEAALTEVLDHGSAPIAAAVRSATSTPAAKAMSAATLSVSDAHATVNVATLAALYYSGQVRNDSLVTVLDLAIGRAKSAASAQQHQAVTGLWQTLALMALLLIVCAVAGWLVWRSLSRPLERLARAARQVSEGVLDDVPVGGPHEVRTAARGLAAAVDSLRNIEAQAAAVADGDIDSVVVREPLPGPLGAVVQASIETIISAIHERDVAQTDLAYRATHDALTDLPNRAQALAMIEQALHRAQRTGATTGLMYVDLDQFKAVNDGFGHDAGDLVLQASAQRMLEVVRTGDTVARLGGDEFAILLEDVTNEADFVRLAERLIQKLSEPVVIDHLLVPVGASIGVAVCRDAYVDPGRLLGEADAAVYRGKQAGRGRVEIFDDDLRESLARRSALEAAILEGLEQGQFVLYYQPVVELQTGRPKGFEALIRWYRPGYGLVQPDDFIPLAENSALINKIGVWTLREATTQLVRWDEESGQTELTVAVNISGRHLASSQLLGDVECALAESGLAPQRLVIEITETVLVDDPIATANMIDLRALGVQISIDDFGTGYTSIGQLPRLPIDTLKIDRSFINSTDPAHEHLVRLIVAAAHAFDLDVVAEGVEEFHNLETLGNCLVDSAQGFFFGRPLPADKAATLTQLLALPASDSSVESSNGRASA